MPETTPSSRARPTWVRVDLPRPLFRHVQSVLADTLSQTDPSPSFSSCFPRRHLLRLWAVRVRAHLGPRLPCLRHLPQLDLPLCVQLSLRVERRARTPLQVVRRARPFLSLGRLHGRRCLSCISQCLMCVCGAGRAAAGAAELTRRRASLPPRQPTRSRRRTAARSACTRRMPDTLSSVTRTASTPRRRGTHASSSRASRRSAITTIAFLTRSCWTDRSRPKVRVLPILPLEHLARAAE